MNKHGLVVLTLATICTACDLPDFGVEPDIYPCDVQSAVALYSSQQRVSFLAKIWGRNSCVRFYKHELRRDGLVIYVKAFAIDPVYRSCNASPYIVDAPISIPIPGPGSYTFKFWRSDSLTYDVPITISE
jgi:hypothetical protein